MACLMSVYSLIIIDYYQNIPENPLYFMSIDPVFTSFIMLMTSDPLIATLSSFLLLLTDLSQQYNQLFWHYKI